MRHLIALLAALPFLLAACGGDDEEPASSSSGATKLELTAEEPFAFDKDTLEAKAGEVTIDLALPDDLQAPHAIAIEGSESGETVEAGSTSTVTAELEPGEYTFFCPVGDHRADGMEGTLTVD